MVRVLKHLIAALVVVFFAGCSGGGCSSGCSGCGMTPLVTEFPTDQRIENSAAVRLTDSGISFIESNLGKLAPTLLGSSLGSGQGGVVTFPIPTSKGSQCLGFTVGGTCVGITFNYTVCPNGSDATSNPPECVAEIDLVGSQFIMKSAAPHDVTVDGTLNLRLQHLTVDSSIGTIVIAASGGGDSECPGKTFAGIPLHKTAGTPGIDISIESELDQSHTARYGYSKADIKRVDFDTNAVVKAVHSCNGGLGQDVLNFLIPLIGNSLVGGLTGSLTGSLGTAFCQKSSPTTPCPAGTTDVGGTCRFGTDANAACVTTILGTAGHVDLGGLLASISPGTTGGLDVLFALGGPSNRADDPQFTYGDLDPANGGITLSMLGGALPAPQSGCVPIANLQLPTGIAVPDELTGNTATDWPSDMPGPHAGVALSERFANFALGSAYNSGLLCLGVTTDSVPQLSSGLFGLLVPSINTLAYLKKGAPLAITIRPQKAPTLAFGNGTDIKTDPTLRVKLPELAMDFYVWSNDRFIRSFTSEFDLDVPVNLDVSAAGITPQLDSIGVTNAKVTNSDLLKEDPKTIADALSKVISGLAGQLTGGLSKPISLNSSLASLGLTVSQPPSVKGQGSPGLRKLTKGSDNYLGIWVSLGLAATPSMIVSNTQAVITDKVIDPAGLRLRTMTKDNGPKVQIRATSSLDTGANKLEYTYRLDRGAWKPWSDGKYITVDDAFLVMQGKHTIDVSSRIVGQPKTEGEPAHLDFAIDIDPPSISVGKVEDGQAKLDVADQVSHDDAVKVRWALDDGAFGAWTTADQVRFVDVGAARSLRVEAQDEEGNVASTKQALIRGRADPALASGSSGCGCSVPGTSSGPSGLGVVATLLGALGIVLRSRGRRSTSKPAAKVRRPLATRTAAVLAVMTVAGTYAGCNCGSDDSTNQTGPGAPAGCDPATECVELKPGLIGAYTSAAVDSSGAIWVSGYLEADWDDGYPWGDLVVGKWSAEKSAVDWQIVDGVPTDNPPDPTIYDVNGFRGGQTDPGDDVGMWSSLALDANGHPHVAYYDYTHKGLKLASFDGTSWTVSVVEQKAGSDLGRYAKLAYLPNGNPVIAYLAVEPGTGGWSTSKVRVARGKSASPASASDWTYEDAATDKQTPCREWLCKNGEVCDKASTQCVKPATSCSPKCASGTACLGDVDAGATPSCETIYDKTKLDSYPEAAGDYVSLAVTSSGALGLVYYDRIHGNLYLAKESAGKWTTLLLDGQTESGTPPTTVDTGDVGIGASLFIDAKGDWHVSYVDGNKESVKYMFVKGGTTPSPAETVDDGLSLGGKKFDDGQHIVGDDSNVFVTQSGEIHVSYQDATSGQLRFAVGAPKGGGGHTWTVKAIQQDGFAGAFSRQLAAGSGTQLVNWWRKGGASVVGDVRVVSP